MAGRVPANPAIPAAHSSDLLPAPGSSSCYIPRGHAETGRVADFVRRASAGRASTRNVGSPSAAINVRTAPHATSRRNPITTSAGLVLQNSERSDPEPSLETQLHSGEAVYWLRSRIRWGGGVY